MSRGGIKLANALDAFGIDVAGRRGLDVGASTGGFTDCLLQRGAEHVIALDVAYGQLDYRLRIDPRVTVIERVNARAVTAAELPYRPELIVIDVSFIAVTKVLGAVLAAAADRFDCLAMVKPQFEVGRGAVGKGGVVRDPELRRGALVSVGAGRDRARRLGARLCQLGPARPQGQSRVVRLDRRGGPRHASQTSTRPRGWWSRERDAGLREDGADAPRSSPTAARGSPPRRCRS